MHATRRAHFWQPSFLICIFIDYYPGHCVFFFFFFMAAVHVSPNTKYHKSFNSCGSGVPLELCGKKTHTYLGCDSHTYYTQKDCGTHDNPCGWYTLHGLEKEFYSVHICRLLLAPHCHWLLWKHLGSCHCFLLGHHTACVLLL